MLPMKASKGDLSKPEQYLGWIAQPKINGIRALWDFKRQRLYSSNEIEILSVPQINETLSKLGDTYFDGELFFPDISFQTLNGFIRRKYPTKESMKFRFLVFDYVSDAIQSHRVRFINEIKEEFVQNLNSFKINTCSEVEESYRKFLEIGFEGIILRNPNASYIPAKRKGEHTKVIQKIKPEFEMECKIIGFIPPADSNSRNSDTFGALALQTKEGKIFTCAGLSDMDRLELWSNQEVGATVTIKYGALSKDAVPLFPRFKAVRWDL